MTLNESLLNIKILACYRARVPASGDKGLATPTLLRTAQGAYTAAIRGSLDAIGVPDFPRTGAYILAGVDALDRPQAELPIGLGLTRQAVSQVIDTLVRRGLLLRKPDDGDRRRMILELTPRGRQALGVVRRAVGDIDRALEERLPASHVAAMRAGLTALAEIGGARLRGGAGDPIPPRQLDRFSPIFPVRSLALALDHYTALGFRTRACDGDDMYGFADRDGIGLHLSEDPEHDPRHGAASTYLYVSDADALYEEWCRSGTGGRTRAVRTTPYGLREGSHVDPDGNIIRFGSPVA